MKPKYKSETGGYGGCIASGLKLTMIGAIIIAICFVLFSCKTMTGPCGDYYRWESKVPFRSK